MKKYKHRTLGVGVSFGSTRSLQTCSVCGLQVLGGISIHDLPSRTGNYDREWFHDKCFLNILLEKKPFKPWTIGSNNYFKKWGWGRCIVCANLNSIPNYLISEKGIHDHCMTIILKDRMVQEVLKEMSLDSNKKNEIIARLI